MIPFIVTKVSNVKVMAIEMQHINQRIRWYSKTLLERYIPKKSDTWKSQLTLAIIFMPFKNFKEESVVHSKKD